MQTRENEVVITMEDVIYSVPFWGIFCIAAIMSAAVWHSYLLPSLFTFALAKYFGSENVHFYKNRLSKFVLRRYPYTTKLLLALILTITIMLSYSSLKAFICSIILSICWKEYMKAFTKRKSLI